MPVLGCIADDFTGATDLASTLVAGGMRTIQVIGVPDGPLPADADAVVVALKSRSIAADAAVAQSRAALAALRAAGCTRIFFKYCSTFDSTDAGNIGPVTEALMAALGAGFTVACPAFPTNGRTVYKGHLFVGDRLLSESGMENHPLNPMRDPDLVRVLGRQTVARVGLIEHTTVAAGPAAITARAGDLAAAGMPIAIADAISDADLMALGAAFAALPLLTGGSGLALGLPAAYRVAGMLGPTRDAAALAVPAGHAAVVSGSCSKATNAQVAAWQAEGRPAFRIDPLALGDGDALVDEAVAFALPRLGDGPVLVYATDTPDGVKAAQARLGPEASGALVEAALAAIAGRLVDAGVARLVVAGGETSGAVVEALEAQQLRIGAPIDPGVPWTTTESRGRPLALALKSGNFGSTDFFAKALARLDG
ncbi:3-oxo-tetronate kinase [Methylobrevis albus]|uniref:3-oxo-tetronate kinase n=1 Tax=Methylobrevis albus TaxID=2793297 RepID=A0A931MZV3_9HYPH|nr:3-oxo-tetronate kinase [Methylobrevis albus]MBH0238494.1 four-carbon acid sugar kinase family protein [Methylobrevis albus]